MVQNGQARFGRMQRQIVPLCLFIPVVRPLYKSIIGASEVSKALNKLQRPDSFWRRKVDEAPALQAGSYPTARDVQKSPQAFLGVLFETADTISADKKCRAVSLRQTTFGIAKREKYLKP